MRGGGPEHNITLHRWEERGGREGKKSIRSRRRRQQEPQQSASVQLLSIHHHEQQQQQCKKIEWSKREKTRAKKEEKTIVNISEQTKEIWKKKHSCCWFSASPLCPPIPISGFFFYLTSFVGQPPLETCDHNARQKRLLAVCEVAAAAATENAPMHHSGQIGGLLQVAMLMDFFGSVAAKRVLLSTWLDLRCVFVYFLGLSWFFWSFGSPR